MYTDNLHNFIPNKASEREPLSDVTYMYEIPDNEYLLVYVEKGKFNLRLGNTTYKNLKSGHFILCSGTTLKYRFSKRHPARVYELSFLKIPDILSPGVYRCADIVSAKKAFSEIVTEFISANKHRDEKLSVLTQNLFITLSRSIEKDTDRDKVLKDLVKDIHENFLHDKTDVESYAGKLNISKDRLSVIFKKKYGLPPYQYQLKLKMDYATDLLLHTDLSIGKIAEKLEFQNQLYFSTAYKKQVGMTPSEMRKRR